MRRGDIVVAAAGGDHGKPRPAVVIQTDALPARHASVVICQFTSDLLEPSRLRITVDPAPENGLRGRSQIMADKPLTVRRDRVRQTIGRLSEDQIRRLDRILIFVLGLGD